MLGLQVWATARKALRHQTPGTLGLKPDTDCLEDHHRGVILLLNILMNISKPWGDHSFLVAFAPKSQCCGEQNILIQISKGFVCLWLCQEVLCDTGVFITHCMHGTLGWEIVESLSLQVNNALTEGTRSFVLELSAAQFFNCIFNCSKHQMFWAWVSSDWNYQFKSGALTPPTVFFLFSIVSDTLGLLCFHIDFNIFFLYVWRKLWNFLIGLH